MLALSRSTTPRGRKTCNRFSPSSETLRRRLKLPDSCTVVAWEWSQFTGLATEMGLPVERAQLLMCRRLATLIARGYPAEDLCETYHLTPEQLSRAATTPVFSNAFEPLAAGR